MKKIRRLIEGIVEVIESLLWGVGAEPVPVRVKKPPPPYPVTK